MHSRMKTDTVKERMIALSIIEQVRDICRARQIACVALAHSDIEFANPEDIKTAFFVYRDAADSVTSTPETITADTDDTAAIIAEHEQQVRELTQRIGELVQQVNERDAMIEKIRTALRQDFSV